MVTRIAVHRQVAVMPVSKDEGAWVLGFPVGAMAGVVILGLGGFITDGFDKCSSGSGWYLGVDGWCPMYRGKGYAGGVGMSTGESAPRPIIGQGAYVGASDFDIIPSVHV
jgi:hypothetical protein